MPAKLPCSAVLCILVVAGLLLAGCTSETPGPAATPVPTTPPLAKYAVGDVIARSIDAADYYLILGYDRASDQYERAYVYRNADGSFGYRADNRTERNSRLALEKGYPVRITSVTLSSVPVATPIPTAESTPAGDAPVLTKISPNAGAKDSTVSVTVTGHHFREGTTVRLLKPGYTPIKATATAVRSDTSIDCTFNLAGFDKGSLNVIVTNPDGQSDTLDGGFKIGIPGPVITSVSPGSVMAGTTHNIVIYGQNFQEPFKATFRREQGYLNCMNPVFEDSTKIFCDLNVPASTQTGDWTLTVLNVVDQAGGSYPRPFVIVNST